MTLPIERKPRQVPPIPMAVQADLARILVPMREALVFLLGQVQDGTLLTEDRLHELGLTDSAVDLLLLPAPKSPFVLDVAKVAGGVAFTLDAESVNYKGHQATEFYRGSTQDFTGASFVGETDGLLFTHFTGEPGVTHYYWFRNRNRAGARSDANTNALSATSGDIPTDGVNSDNVADDTVMVGGTTAGEVVESVEVADHGYNIFNDNFEDQDLDLYADAGSGSPTITFPANGETGGYVVRAAGAQAWYALRRNIPYDATKLYRFTARARMTTAPSDPAKDAIYFGVVGVAADGVTLINAVGANSHGTQHYLAANGFDMGSVGLSTWQKFVGYFKGHTGAPTLPAPSPQAPTGLYTGVKYIRPMFILNYSAGNGTMEIDDLSIEIVDAIDTIPTLDALPDGPTYGRPLLTRLNAGKPWIDFSEGIHSNKNQDNVADGSTYSRILGSELSSGAHKLTVAGSNMRTADARNVNQVFASNTGAVLSVQPLTAADVGSTVTISIAAFTLYIGSLSVSYNSGSITGLSFSPTVAKYYVYCDDANLAGGSVTYVATSDPLVANQGNGRVYLGSIVPPVDGGGGTGGGGGGGDPCVEAAAWVDMTTQALDVVEGSTLTCLRGEAAVVACPVIKVWEPEAAPCVEIETESGARLVVSHRTPVTVLNGRTVAAADLLGSAVGVIEPDGRQHWNVVCAVRDVGPRIVAHISLGGESFAATSVAGGARIFTHNPMKP